MKTNTSLLLWLPSLIVTSSFVASAQVSVTSDYNTTSRTFFPVSNTDLINAESPFLTAGPDSLNYDPLVIDGLDFDLTNINDGSNSNSDGSILQDGSLTTADVGTEAFTVDFFLGNNPNGSFGFDLTSITLTSNGADRRVNQSAEIFVRQFGSSDFVSLHSYTYTPNLDNSTGTFSAQSTITTPSGFLATNVDAIRFTTFVAAGGTAAPAHTVWSEFDVQGVAVIPEPASFTLLLGGGILLAVLSNRRRRR